MSAPKAVEPQDDYTADFDEVAKRLEQKLAEHVENNDEVQLRCNLDGGVRYTDFAEWAKDWQCETDVATRALRWLIDKGRVHLCPDTGSEVVKYSSCGVVTRNVPVFNLVPAQ